MTEKFLDKRRNIYYKARFSRSEGINGFLKGDNGVLKLIGTTESAVNNEIQLRNTIYNLTRPINLKDTAYWVQNHKNSIVCHKNRLYAVSETYKFFIKTLQFTKNWC